MDYSRLMSPAPRARQIGKSAALERLFALPDRWLARELVTMARHVRNCCPSVFGSAYRARSHWQSVLFWDIVPEVASRLGEVEFHPLERSAWVRGLDGSKLRADLADILEADHGVIRHLDRVSPSGFNAYSILVNDPVHGNPAAFGLDRVCPPRADDPDSLAAGMLAYSRLRGHEPSMEWRPELNAAPPRDPEWHVAPEVRI